MSASAERIQEVRDYCKAHGCAPNKALGQNFLVDGAALDAIVEAARIEGRAVLEIGPGLGALSAGILARAARAAAVELDASLCAHLRGRFGSAWTLFHADFLRCDFKAVHESLGGGPFCVLGNLPYYITTPACMRLITSGLPIESMTLMLQKEAAARFFAIPGTRTYGPLGILAQLYFEVESVCTLSPQSFYPQPAVDSQVVRLVRNSRPYDPGLPALLEAAFHMRRKTLFNNLKAIQGESAKLEAALAACSIAPGLRAEALAPEAFVPLAQALL